MTIEIFAFFVFAVSLVLAGFVSGPMVAKRVKSSGHRHPHFH